MKRILNIFLIMTAMSSIFNGCTKKEVDVISSFDFMIEEAHETTSIINFPQETTISISPEKEVTSNNFSYKYEVIEGSGNYYDDENNILPQNEFIEISGKKLGVFYKGEDIHTDRVRITIKDKGGKEKSLDILYDVKQNAFSLEASTPLNDINVNAPTSFSFSLLNLGKDKTVTYERSFNIIQGTGKVFNEDGSTEVELEKYEPVDEGTFSHVVKFTQPGDSKIVVSAKDSNNQIISDTLSYTVNVVEFSFTAAPSKNTVYTGEEVEVNFTLNETQGSGGQYKMGYTLNDGSADISVDGVAISPGTLNNVPVGDFSWTVKPTSVGVLDMTFYVRNESGSEVQKNVAINSQSGNFTVQAIPTVNSASINEKVTINIAITENGPPAKPYSLSFGSTGSGTIEYNGNQYNAGQTISSINSLDFSVDYTGSTVGDHNITLFFTNSNGLPLQKSLSIQYETTTFTFDAATTVQSVKVNEKAKQNFNVVQSGSQNLTYTLSFTSTGSGTLEYNSASYGQNQTITGITPGSFSADYIGSSVGEHRITYKLTASNGDFIEKSVTIDMVANPFLTVHSWGLPDDYYYENTSLRDMDIAFSNNIIETNPELEGNLKMKWKLTGGGGQVDAVKLNYLAINAVGNIDSSNATPEDTYVVIPNNQDFTILFNYERLGTNATSGNYDEITFTVTNGTQTKTYVIRVISRIN